MSLPRGFGKRERLGYQQQQVVPPLPPARVPSPRSDSVTVLRNLMMNRHRVRVSDSHPTVVCSDSHVNLVCIPFAQFTLYHMS
jgi:hypothetical protein